jgi:hypothetical protein
MMRHLRSYKSSGKSLPVVKRESTVEKETFDSWKAKHTRSANDSSPEKEEEKETAIDEQCFLHLKTESGEIKYKPSDYSNQTDFLRAVIEISLAFNSAKVDPAFRKVIRMALFAYENGDVADEFGGGGFGEGDEDDEYLIEAAIESAQAEAQKMEDASKLTSNLPATDKLRLQILSTEDSNVSHIDKLLCKHTDLPPTDIEGALKNNTPFIMPSDAAKELYVQLRMLDVVLSIQPVDKALVQKPITTKTGAAAKKATRKSVGTKVLPKNPLTGREKLPLIDGIITKYNGSRRSN